MRSGSLRHPVTLQAPLETPDGLMGRTETWTDEGTVWAEIWALRGDERIEAAKVEAVVTHRIRIRYWAGLTTKHRIVFNGRTFNVRFVNNVNERSIEMILDVEERPDAG